MRMRFRVSKRGPIFDGRARAAMRGYCRDLEDDLADKAVDELHKEFDIHFKHPTGYYKSQVRVRKSGGDKVVSDGGVVYGPWLEGVGSRNFPATRFKGYRSFRRVAARLNEGKKSIAERLLHSKWLRRMT